MDTILPIMIFRTRLTAVCPDEARRAVTGANHGVTAATVQALTLLLAIRAVSAFWASKDYFPVVADVFLYSFL